jgi:hypothetical protein
MRPSLTLKRPRLALLIGGALLLAAAVAVVVNHSAARANGTTGTSFVSYTAPTGPEKSASLIANKAVQLAREWGEDGEITVELAHGTMIQARALMEGQSLTAAQAYESQLRSDTPSDTFCFGGQNANCSTVEQQQAREELYAEGRASTYLVLMSGANFTPPERLPKGKKPVVSDKIMLLIDAHTGISAGITIGAGMTTPNLGELQDTSRFVAAPQSTFARAASVKSRLTNNRGSHPRPKFGSISGVFKHGREVVIYSGRSIFMKIAVKAQHFHAVVHMGSYSLRGRLRSGRSCLAKKVTVVPQQETVVHLTC